VQPAPRSIEIGAACHASRSSRYRYCSPSRYRSSKLTSAVQYVLAPRLQLFSVSSTSAVAIASGSALRLGGDQSFDVCITRASLADRGAFRIALQFRLSSPRSVSLMYPPMTDSFLQRRCRASSASWQAFSETFVAWRQNFYFASSQLE
jgi:hypothetical protein